MTFKARGGIVICGINCRRRRRKLCYTEPFLPLREFFSRLAVEVTMYLFYYSCSTVCVKNSYTDFFFKSNKLFSGWSSHKVFVVFVKKA